jgi:mRNA-degrading endonuclease RelE of RelBE toxin-antitoxin system
VLQVTFSDQSLQALNSLPQVEQLDLVEKLSSLTNSILSERNTEVGKFFRKNKCFYRIRVGDLRVYFEQVTNALEKLWHLLYFIIGPFRDRRVV